MLKETWHFIKEEYLSRKTGAPSPEKRIFDAMQALEGAREALAQKFTLPEINKDFAKASGPHDEDLTFWCFDSVVLDRLKDKGWPTDTVSYQGTVGGAANELIMMLSPQFQGGSRVNMEMYINDFKKRNPQNAEAVKFLYAHVDSLEAVAAELPKLDEKDLKPQHQMVAIGENRRRAEAVAGRILRKA